MSDSCNVDDNIYRLPVDLEDTHVSEIGLKGRKQAQMDNLTQEHITHSGVRSGLKAHRDQGVLQEETSTAHPTPHGSMWPPTSCAQHHQVSQAAKGTHFQPKSSYRSSKEQKIMGLVHHVGSPCQHTAPHKSKTTSNCNFGCSRGCFFFVNEPSC